MIRIAIRRALTALMLVSTYAAAAPATSLPAGSCKDPITISAKDDAALRDAFNQAQGSVRLVFLVDPICPGCLRGLKDLDAAVLTPLAGESSLRTFIVHTPVLGATEADAANTCALVHNEHVVHYWDPNQEIGTLFSTAENMKKGDALVYAWDVWLVYAPSAKWTGTAPPKGAFVMHQLKDLMKRPEFPYLNAPAFRAEVDKQLRAVAASPKPAAP
jgi:hypothetical protein